jgi:hypothetical protein
VKEETSRMEKVHNELFIKYYYGDEMKEYGNVGTFSTH